VQGEIDAVPFAAGLELGDLAAEEVLVRLCVIQPEPVPVLGQSGDSMPTNSTPACSRATFTKPPM
jgi:hypothetical protein